MSNVFGFWLGGLCGSFRMCGVSEKVLLSYSTRPKLFSEVTQCVLKLAASSIMLELPGVTSHPKPTTSVSTSHSPLRSCKKDEGGENSWLKQSDATTSAATLQDLLHRKQKKTINQHRLSPLPARPRYEHGVFWPEQGGKRDTLALSLQKKACHCLIILSRLIYLGAGVYRPLRPIGGEEVRGCEIADLFFFLKFPLLSQAGLLCDAGPAFY